MRTKDTKKLHTKYMMFCTLGASIRVLRASFVLFVSSFSVLIITRQVISPRRVR